MRVVLTGSSGFLGGHAAEAFQLQGHKVIGIVRSSSSTALLSAAGIEVFACPLEDEPRLQQAMQHVDAVVHVAARVHTHGLWQQFVGVTVEGTRHVLQAAIAARVPRFIQISTVGVYGFPRSRNPAPFREADGYGHIHRWNYYSRAKIEAEKIVLAAHESGRIATTILRPTWVYGPRDSTTFPRITAALKNRRLKWIGDGQNKLSLIHVTDVARAVVLSATSSSSAGHVYNVSADETSPTQRDFITRICELTDSPPPASSVPYNTAYAMAFAGECVAHLTRYRICPPLTRLSVLLLGGPRRYNSDRIRAELAWKPTVTFDEGILQTAQWYRGLKTPLLAASPG